jgi:hypothetical protein
MASNSGSDDASSDEDEPLGATLMPEAAGELEGSSTKYLQDQIGSDEDGTSPTAASSSEPQSTAKIKDDTSEKVPKYVEVDPLRLTADEQPKSKPQPQQDSVEYVKLKPVLQVKKAPEIEVRKPSKVQSEPTRTVRGEKGMYRFFYVLPQRQQAISSAYKTVKILYLHIKQTTIYIMS